MSNSFTLKLVTTTPYHLWCDALHARALARQTKDDWMRGTYVRWCIITAWAVLELCCQEAVNNKKATKNMPVNLNKCIKKIDGVEVDWDDGLWKEVDSLRLERIYYIHENENQEKLWPEITAADEAIRIVRDAAKDIFIKSNKTCPYNIDDDDEKGWRIV